MDKVIEEWFREYFSAPIIAERTDIYNHCFAAKQELKKRLSPSTSAADDKSDKKGGK